MIFLSELTENEVAGILFIVFLFLFLILYPLYLLFNNIELTKKVLYYSEKLKKQYEINQMFNFNDIGDRLIINVKCNSKRMLEYKDFDESFLIELKKNEEKYKNLINIITENRKKLRKYNDLINQLNYTISYDTCKANNMNYRKSIRREKRIFSNRIKKPDTNIEILLQISYISSQERTNCNKVKIYYFDELCYFFKEMNERKLNEQKRVEDMKAERLKMTESLRYDILKRDNFKCQICGYGAKDGVKLHVDHIVPVSKGGQTIPSNLRVLCDRCNFGKRDKI